MYNRLAMPALIGIITLAACGGAAAGNGVTPTMHATPAPSTSPESQSNMPIQETVAGAAAFVNPANHHTLYFVDGDTPPGAGCPAGACTAEWPVLTPAGNAQAQGNLTIVTRIDGTKQWSFNGHPLYEFSGDSGPDQSFGVYGTWHMARP
jgi:predicted lipoprotein with Yx(FWY)xxD motif